MKSILVLMAPGFEEIELTAPVDILRRLGVKVVLAGVQGRKVEGAHGLTMMADMLLVDAEAGDYDGVVLPGGAASWLLRDTPAVLKMVRDMHAAGKLVAAICAAPIALEAAGVLSERRITCYPADAVTNDIKSAASIADTPAVTDGNIVTGRGPGAALEFGFALGAYLGLDVEALRKEMCAG
ncbi:MAG: DJ-1/PfpI family protein [Akkermansia sp.]|nr:DJ-1/PfpI family protein [Akkermansia sp.]